MKTVSNPKKILSGYIELAKSRDSRGDAVNRDHVLRNIEDLPLPASYVCAALRNAGLLKTYRGPRP